MLLKNNLQVISNQYNADIQAKNLEISKRDKLPSVSGSFNNNMTLELRKVSKEVSVEMIISIIVLQ